MRKIGNPGQVDLSVIIPVWKTPVNLLQKSIESACVRDEIQIEILVVDDGNEKEYVNELSRLEEMNSKVSILHQEHRGVSAARNLGLRHASGNYLTFLDADDEFNTDALEKMIRLCRERQPDLVISRISRSDRSDYGKGKILEGSNDLRRALRIYYTTLRNPEFRERETWINRAPHGRFLARGLAEECKMKEDLAFGEDVVWNFDLLNRARKFLVTDLQAYCYRKHSFSATQSRRESFPYELKKLLHYYRNEISKWPQQDQKYYDVAAVEYFTILMRLYVFAGESSLTRKRFLRIWSDPLWRKVFGRCRWQLLSGRYRVVGILGKLKMKNTLYLLLLFYDRLVRKRMVET